ncbi:transposase, partial [Micromonospora sp. ALFpr18c]|uniref:transposase n=1 Tax=Micromonospora sp. ALFpr18c TaxID=1458665 RepID=UPI00351A0E06
MPAGQTANGGCRTRHLNDHQKTALFHVPARTGVTTPKVTKRSKLDLANALTPFLAFPPEVRRIIYTTNAIESFNYQIRKVIKNRGHFPTDDA